MKNPKNFDYDKQRPNNTKKYIIQGESDINNKDDYNKIFNEPPLIKVMEINQGPPNKAKKSNKSMSKSSVITNNTNTNKLKGNNAKKTNKKTVDNREKAININSDDLSNISDNQHIKDLIKDNDSQKDEIDFGIIIPNLPESEKIEPDEPLPEEGKFPNPIFVSIISQIY